MVKKRIGALIPVWNQEKFISQHIRMLRGVDKIVVLLEQEPLGAYQREHNYGLEKDETEEIVKSLPNVEWHIGNYRGEFSCGLFNEGLEYVKDCDMVIKLDPDCFFTDSDWDRLINHIHENNHDCYKINCQTNSINYYITNRFDFGVRDGMEPAEVYIFNPKKPLTGITAYDAENPCLIDESWGDFTMHHFKGWKKSAIESILNVVLKDYKRYTAPQEIIDKLK